MKDLKQVLTESLSKVYNVFKSDLDSGKLIHWLKATVKSAYDSHEVSVDKYSTIDDLKKLSLNRIYSGRIVYTEIVDTNTDTRTITIARDGNVAKFNFVTYNGELKKIEYFPMRGKTMDSETVDKNKLFRELEKVFVVENTFEKFLRLSNKFKGVEEIIYRDLLNIMMHGWVYDDNNDECAVSEDMIHNLYDKSIVDTETVDKIVNFLKSNGLQFMLRDDKDIDLFLSDRKHFKKLS